MEAKEKYIMKVMDVFSFTRKFGNNFSKEVITQQPKQEFIKLKLIQ